MIKNKRSIKSVAKEEKNHKGSRNKKEEIKTIVQTAPSYKFKDGRIAEMIHDVENQETKFALYDNQKVDLVSQIQLGEVKTDLDGQKFIRILRPLSPEHGLIKRSFIKLPSEATDYGTNLELFLEIKEFLSKYVILPEDFTIIASVYVMLTWVYDQFNTIPYLRVLGTLGTGKSRFLTATGNLCYKAMISGGSASMSSVFRTIDKVEGTFVFDEAEFKNSEMWSEIIKLLNGGHSKDFSVLRTSTTKDGDFETQTFNVYGPKIFASRERFTDQALESRCLCQHLWPLESSSADIHLPKSFGNEAQNLRNKLLMFRFLNLSKIQEDESTVAEIKFPRLKQTSLALTSIAQAISIDVLKQVMNFLVLYEKDLETINISDPQADVLLSILDCLTIEEVIRSKKLKIKELTEIFNIKFYTDFADKPTRTIDTRDNGPLSIPGYIVSPRKIGALIKKLGIRTGRNGDGIYIPVAEEFNHIKSLAHRYGLGQFKKIPENFSELRAEKMLIENDIASETDIED